MLPGLAKNGWLKKKGMASSHYFSWLNDPERITNMLP